MNDFGIMDLEKPRKGKLAWNPDSGKTAAEKIHFQDWFGNANPVEIELGCGKGRFLLERSATHLEINFIGIDWSRKWLGVGASRSESPGRKNIRWIWGRVDSLLNRLLPGSVSVFHIYFPDPWPKRKHGERRLISREFLERVHTLLIPGGRIEIATDYADYFESMLSSVAKAQVGWHQMGTRMNERLFDPGIKTHYELKYAAEGKPLYYLELIKATK